ncbi:hypothetical protein [Bacillus sp. AFS076308]|nr:hypothetical protein [Bacillus sp. AFS076308]
MNIEIETVKSRRTKIGDKMRIKKQRGLKRKTINMVKRIEQATIKLI